MTRPKYSWRPNFVIQQQLVDLLGPLVWYIPTTICGILVVLAGFLTLFQPETKGQGLKDHVEDDAKLADDNADIELTKK